MGRRERAKLLASLGFELTTTSAALSCSPSASRRQRHSRELGASPTSSSSTASIVAADLENKLGIAPGLREAAPPMPPLLGLVGDQGDSANWRSTISITRSNASCAAEGQRTPSPSFMFVARAENPGRGRRAESAYHPHRRCRNQPPNQRRAGARRPAARRALEAVGVRRVGTGGMTVALQALAAPVRNCSPPAPSATPIA